MKLGKLTRTIGAVAAVIAAASTTAVLAPAPAYAETDLSGNWRGTGYVTFKSGDRERARCRATFWKKSPTNYHLNATCATASAQASQAADINLVGTNRYTGTFRNYDFDVTGKITVAVSGSTLKVELNGDGHSGSVTLRR